MRDRLLQGCWLGEATLENELGDKGPVLPHPTVGVDEDSGKLSTDVYL